MARYKHIDTSQRLLPVDLHQQLQPGTFEHALDYLLDHLIDLQGFDDEFSDDDAGAPAYLGKNGTKKNGTDLFF